MFAHSLRFVLPRMTAPAARSLCATNESLGGFDPTSASDPAVVIILSAVSMLSLISTGTPCSGPRGPLAFRSSSSASAIESASGFSSMIAFMAGPRLSISSMRAWYFSTSERAVYLSDFIPSCSSGIVISSSSKALTSVAPDSVVGVIVLPALRAGNRAAVPPVVKAACRNLRREGAQFGDGIVSRSRTRIEPQADYLNTNDGTSSRARNNGRKT